MWCTPHEFSTIATCQSCFAGSICWGCDTSWHLSLELLLHNHVWNHTDRAHQHLDAVFISISRFVHQLQAKRVRFTPCTSYLEFAASKVSWEVHLVPSPSTSFNTKSHFLGRCTLCPPPLTSIPSSSLHSSSQDCSRRFTSCPPPFPHKMSTSNKHQLDEPDVLEPNKRPKQPDNSRLSIDHAFKKRALGGLKKHELWEMFFEVGQAGLDDALAHACLHHLRPGCAALQTRYHKLSFNNITEAEKIIKQANRPRPRVKVCTKAIRSFGDIQIACRLNENTETYLESVKLGAAYFSVLLSTEGENADEHIPDSRDRFLALIEILEQHEPGFSPQGESTPGPGHRSSQAAPSVPSFQSTQAAAPELRSDDYLQAKALQCQVTLQDNIIEWDQLLGLEVVKAGLESSIETFLLDSVDCSPHIPEGPPAGVFLHGPQECGKTSIATSFAKKFKLPLFQLDNNITGKYVDETRKYDDTTFCSWPR
jgi:hypothetical protein